MDLHLILYCLVFIFATRNVESAGRWRYLSRDPGLSANDTLPVEKWPEDFPKCGRHNQSPINFDTSRIQPSSTLTEILFVDYDEYPPQRTWNILNNGHTVVVKGNYSCRPQLQGGALGSKYELVQLHFHWGEEDFEGSEHRVDGHRYPLELHLVHTKRVHEEKTGGKEEQLRNEFEEEELNLAVVGIFFDVVTDEDANPNLDPLIQALEKVVEPDESVDLHLPTFNLQSLLPKYRDYYRYTGSLTTPPCDPIVQWSVFRQPVPISRQQMAAFRRLEGHVHDEDGKLQVVANMTESRIRKNFRPVQPVGNRIVSLYSSQFGSPRADIPSSLSIEPESHPTDPERRNSGAASLNQGILPLTAGLIFFFSLL